MPSFEPRLLFAALGALFLVLGAGGAWRAGKVSPQSRSWLLIGILFGAVSAWLQWRAR